MGRTISENLFCFNRIGEVCYDSLDGYCDKFGHKDNSFLLQSKPALKFGKRFFVCFHSSGSQALKSYWKITLLPPCGIDKGRLCKWVLTVNMFSSSLHCITVIVIKLPRRWFIHSPGARLLNQVQTHPTKNTKHHFMTYDIRIIIKTKEGK